MNEALKYLQPEVVAQLTTMELRARLVVEGFITGLHKSPYHGFSVEFTEHRQYMPGDEIKHIDWKAYAKTDRYYIKQFEEETNLKSYVLIDASASMKYASPGHMPKIEYASYIAAALSYLMVEQRDAAGLTVYDERVRTSIPRFRGKPRPDRNDQREIFQLEPPPPICVPRLPDPSDRLCIAMLPANTCPSIWRGLRHRYWAAPTSNL